MKRMIVGEAAQIRYEFLFRLQINTSYKIGITNSLDAGSSDSKMLPHSASLGYRF